MHSYMYDVLKQKHQLLKLNNKINDDDKDN